MYNPNVYFQITVNIILPHHKLIERINGSHIVQSMMFFSQISNLTVLGICTLVLREDNYMALPTHDSSRSVKY